MCSSLGTVLVASALLLAKARGLGGAETSTLAPGEDVKQDVIKGAVNASPVPAVLPSIQWPSLTSIFRMPFAMAQGRGNKNKGQGGLLAMMAGMVLMMALSALAALSGKALAASMAALLLAAMSMMKKHHARGHGSHYDVISFPLKGEHYHRTEPEGEPYAKEYIYDNSAESLSATSTTIINNHHMSVR